LAELKILKFSELLADSGQPISLLRESNDRDANWVAQFVLTEHPDAQTIIEHMRSTWILDNTAPLDLNPSDVVIEKIPDDIDWRAESYRAFPAFSVGYFFIYGSHHEGSVPDRSIGLQIDAATAFGSGEHGTTKGCLMMMLDLKARGVCPWNVLDMGTGSGILGIAAWKLWKTPVLGIDNDPEAVRVAAHHAAINGVPDDATGMMNAVGNGFHSLLAQKKKPYELVIANILAGPLMDMADDLKECVDENGYVILSGILNEQAEDVIAAYTACGLKLRTHEILGDWSSLLLQRVS
jgi:ribosomal protein L11 methyltransferase